MKRTITPGGNTMKKVIISAVAALAAVLALAAPASASGNIQSVCQSAFKHARIINECVAVQRNSAGFRATGFRGRAAMVGSDSYGTNWRFVFNDRGYHKATQVNSYGTP
jgi:acid phosphatase class B